MAKKQAKDARKRTKFSTQEIVFMLERFGCYYYIKTVRQGLLEISSQHGQYRDDSRKTHSERWSINAFWNYLQKLDREGKANLEKHGVRNLDDLQERYLNDIALLRTIEEDRIPVVRFSDLTHGKICGGHPLFLGYSQFY